MQTSHTSQRRRTALSIAISIMLALIAWNTTSSHRVWKPSEVPIAYWSWRSAMPSETDVDAAIRETGANSLFVRAGQIDFESEKLRRIRPASGALPGNIAVHLTYNATRSFLKDLERIDPSDAASVVLAAFAEDVERAVMTHARVVGLQLDFDVPTRLLTNYAAVLSNIRKGLEKEQQLSITGLPTWLKSPLLREPLSVCDFWIPQCYGAQIPENLRRQIPIATPDQVANSIALSRDLGLPFYAGLAGYGYAIHYSRDGSLIGLRGDLDPQTIVSNDDFELASRTPFVLPGNSKTERKVGELQYTYRARRDTSVDGTDVRAGESFLLDRPTAEGLRACARKVREQGGERLLGICVFRLPELGDKTTLTLAEMTSALSDTEPHFSLSARVDEVSIKNTDKQTLSTVLILENNGSVGSKMGQGALSVLVHVPPGVIEAVRVDRSTSAEPVFESGGEALRCTLKRANAIKLTVDSWPPGSRLQARFETKDSGLNEISVIYSSTLDDGSVLEGQVTPTRTGTL